MDQEFYLKARVLYEEFQKKELHYLNMERKMHHSIMWKKDLNLPLQEYLQRINKRAKETEESFKNILEKMEELDQHTDTLSLKLEKLGILQASIATPISSNWFQGLNYNVGSDNPTAGTHSLVHMNKAIALNAMSISTQTENDLYCKKCNILDSNEPSSVLGSLSASNPHLRMMNNTETEKSSNHQSNLVTQNVPQHMESRSIERISLSTNNSLEENFKLKHFEKENSEQRSESREVSENKSNLVENQTHIDNESVVDNTQYYILKNNENPSVLQSVVSRKRDDQIRVHDGELNKEALGSKSDADSMNNEFDFLESNTVNKPVVTKMKTNENVENIKSITNHAGATSKAKQSGESQLQLKDSAVSPSSKLTVAKEESEASGSLSGYNSPHMSVASDSDVDYEKESPLAASAAYQALLGNTVDIARAPQQKESGSESEDEVESALASAVQRNQVKSKSFGKQIQDGTSHQPPSSKLPEKPTKLTSSSKPQSKLSKNTRKVLGLDSSSGSEVEIPVNPPKQKTIDEDSDEFGFYD